MARRQFHDFDEPANELDSHRQCMIRVLHSNDDEVFVWSLRGELAKMGYDGFVDDDVESYAGGQEAVEGRFLVLIVLSEKFLGSEASMIKLKSVSNNSQWFYLFYELSLEEFLDRISLAEWQEIRDSLPGINLGKNKAAWRSRLHGWTLDCPDGNMTRAINLLAETNFSRFLPLQVHWSKEASHIQGRVRLCDEVRDLFLTRPRCEHARLLGLHGMWSVGKTSLAKALCDYYRTEFQGRVYHAELLKKSSHLHLVKDLLCHLLGAKEKFLKQHLANLSQAYAYLDHCLKQSSEKVFLVVDNIQDSWECLELARNLLLRCIPFPEGSMIVCLARSSHTLERLFLPLETTYHIEPVPSITSSEGYDIFVDSLFSNLSEGEASLWENVKLLLGPSRVHSVIVDRLSCTLLDGIIHPLIFKSLGCFFREKGAEYCLSAFAERSADAILKDLEDLGKWEKDNALKIVFEALHEIYEPLDRHVQQLFLDVALYVPVRDLSWLEQLAENGEDDLLASGFERLQKLRVATLLTIEERKLKIPTVCRRFAEKVAKASKALVYVVGETVGRPDVLCSKSANVIERIAFKDCSFDDGDTLEPFVLDLSKCEQLQVLQLLNVKSQHVLVEVCLGHSKLVTLEILSVSTPMIITGDLSSVRCFSWCLGMIACSKLNLASLNFENLKVFEMYNIDAETEQRLRELIRMGDFWSTLDHGSKKSVRVESNLEQSLQKLTSGDVESSLEPECRRFGVDMQQRLGKETLGDFQSTFECGSQKYHADTNMEQSLGKFSLVDFQSLCELEVLQVGGNSLYYPIRELDLLFLPTLKQLTLFRINGLESLRSLDKLQNLRSLLVQGLNDLESLDGIKTLSRLQELHVIKCNRVSYLCLPGSMWLTHCCVWFCGSLRTLDVYKLSERGQLSTNMEAPVTGTVEHQDEKESFYDNEEQQLRRYYPSSDEGIGQMTCSDSENRRELVHFSSGSKFSVRGCRKLFAGLTNLTSVGAFEVQPVYPRNVVLDAMDFQRLSVVKAERSASPAMSSDIKFVSAAGLRKLEVMDVQVKGYVRDLVDALHTATTSLEFLAVQCEISMSNLCGCEECIPDFSLLPESLSELTYECSHVTDLASIGYCNQVRELKLISCFSVHTWPEPSQMLIRYTSKPIPRRRTWRRQGPLLVEMEIISESEGEDNQSELMEGGEPCESSSDFQASKKGKWSVSP